MSRTVTTRQGTSLVRKAKGMGIAAAVLVGGFMAIHIAGFVLGIVGTIMGLLIPATIVFALVWVLYRLFLKE